MDIVFWIIIIACFILSFVGLVYPVIPSVLVIWVGVGVYHFGINSNELSWISWTLLVILTLLLFLADYLANLHFVDKAGGSKWGMRVATIGLIVGSFVIPPFGVVIVPFVLVLIARNVTKENFPRIHQSGACYLYCIFKWNVGQSDCSAHHDRSFCIGCRYLSKGLFSLESMILKYLFNRK